VLATVTLNHGGAPVTFGTGGGDNAALLITDNLQSTTGCPTVVEFWQGLRLDRDLDVEEQDDNPDKRFTQV
jgi:hypothetical protein